MVGCPMVGNARQSAALGCEEAGGCSYDGACDYWTTVMKKPKEHVQILSISYSGTIWSL